MPDIIIHTEDIPGLSGYFWKIGRVRYSPDSKAQFTGRFVTDVKQQSS